MCILYGRRVFNKIAYEILNWTESHWVEHRSSFTFILARLISFLLLAVCHHLHLCNILMHFICANMFGVAIFSCNIWTNGTIYLNLLSISSASTEMKMIFMLWIQNRNLKITEHNAQCPKTMCHTVNENKYICTLHSESVLQFLHRKHACRSTKTRSFQCEIVSMEQNNIGHTKCASNIWFFTNLCHSKSN